MSVCCRPRCRLGNCNIEINNEDVRRGSRRLSFGLYYRRYMIIGFCSWFCYCMSNINRKRIFNFKLWTRFMKVTFSNILLNAFLHTGGWLYFRFSTMLSSRWWQKVKSCRLDPDFKFIARLSVGQIQKETGKPNYLWAILFMIVKVRTFILFFHKEKH